MLTVTFFNPLKISQSNFAAGGQLVNLSLCHAPIRARGWILVFFHSFILHSINLYRCGTSHFVLTIAVLVFLECLL
jgi:hypothetical protein